jgi:hypothetical protein
VDLEANIAVKRVIIYNWADGCCPERLNDAKVSLIDSANKFIETVTLTGGIRLQEIIINFGLSNSASSVVAWRSPSSAGEPLLSDGCKTQLKTQFRLNMDIFDASIALVFGNKTTIGQVCSFAKGLKSNTVTNIPGFCCLDAPYQSKIEEWGEKVSSWDARRLVL